MKQIINAVVERLQLDKSEKYFFLHELVYSVLNMRMSDEKCVNCKISSVPLYPCADGKKRCADHAGMIFPGKDKPKKKEESNHEQTI